MIFKLFDTGMHNLNAHALISFLVPFHTIHKDNFSYYGKYKTEALLIHPQVNEKKAKVTLNGFGFVDGPGFDTHCIWLVSLLLKKIVGHGADAQQKRWSVYVGEYK